MVIPLPTATGPHMRTATPSLLVLLDPPLPALTSLTPHLARSHQPDKLLELVIGEIGADSSETTGYVFAHQPLAERVDFRQTGVTVGVLLCFHANPPLKKSKVRHRTIGAVSQIPASISEIIFAGDFTL